MAYNEKTRMPCTVVTTMATELQHKSMEKSKSFVIFSIFYNFCEKNTLNFESFHPSFLWCETICKSATYLLRHWVPSICDFAWVSTLPYSRRQYVPMRVILMYIECS